MPQFLRETETVDYRPPAVETSERIRAHQLDFNFRIPRRLISTRSDVNPRFLELYPSAQMGSSCRAYAARQQYMQPLIFYRIIAMIPKSAKNVYAQAYLRDWYCERVIKIIPTKVADPPLYVRAYPDEYRLESSVKLRSRLYSPSIGELRISAEEPVPFNLAAPTPRASTGVPLKLSISANDSFMSSKEPYNWTVTVQTRVLLRTFHSTRALNYEPTLQDLMSDHLAMRMESTKEEIRYYTGLQWGVDQLPKGTAVRQSEMLRPPLTSKLYVTVSLPKSSVPSFLTPLAALRYSVILKTTVVGTKSSPATVEVPVQVHRCPVTASSEGPRDGNQQMSGYPRPRNSNSFWEDESDDIVEGTTSQLDEQLPRYR